MSTSLVDIKAQLKAELERQRERLAPVAGGSISTAGKVFTLPDGRSSQGPLQLVILDWRIHHAFYTGMYDPAKPVPPVCWAAGPSVADCAPPARVPSPKAATCLDCAFNQFGSAAGGTGKGKACKETRRLAVIAPDAQTEAEIIMLEVSPTGITPFEKYILLLQGKGLHPVQVTTEVAFRSDAAYPTLTFGSPQLLGDDALALAFSLKDAAARMLDKGASI
jgi:hypothetical protein